MRALQGIDCLGQDTFSLWPAFLDKRLQRAQCGGTDFAVDGGVMIVLAIAVQRIQRPLQKSDCRSCAHANAGVTQFTCHFRRNMRELVESWRAPI